MTYSRTVGTTLVLLVAGSGAIAFQGPAKPNLPYKAIENPEFIPAREAKFMGDRDRMIGVIGGNEVFQDRESGSRWQQSSLQAISGPMKGEHLQLRPFLLTNWGEWRKLHPGTLVLKPLPGYAERIPEVNRRVQAGLSQRGNAPDGVLRQDSRLPPKTMVLGLDAGGGGKAYPLNALRQTRVVNDTIGGAPVVIVHQPGSDTTTAFSAKLNGKTLRFAAANRDLSRLTDLGTHSQWDPYGNCVGGKLKGAKLEPLILEPEYWFAWSEFHPDTAIFALPSGGSR